MKTAVEIAYALFRDAKAAAVIRGVSLSGLMTEALREKLGGPKQVRQNGWPVPPPNLIRGEAARIQSIIDD